MDEEKRDELLIITAERVRVLKDDDMPKVLSHLEKINDKVGRHEVRLTRNDLQWKILGGAASLIISGSIAKLLGWF